MADTLLYRARFGPDIVAEFSPSAYPSNKVAILATGCPGYPGNKDVLMKLLSKKGYWSFIPRYRGSWESSGTFLECPPSDDLIVVMDHLTQCFRDVWSGSDFCIENPEVYLIGGSFGGAAVTIASRDARVKKAVALSAMVDWTKQERTVEPLDVMNTYLPEAFGPAYRPVPGIWEKLAQGEFFNPVHEKATLDGSKLLFIHAKDDLVTHAEHSQALAREIGAKHLLVPRGGHWGVGAAAKPFLWKHIDRFFRSR